jgi:hypothetical protein
MKELEKLRQELKEAGEDTGEEFDEPLDPLPPAPLPPWPLGHPVRPYRLYVNLKTGRLDMRATRLMGVARCRCPKD